MSQGRDQVIATESRRCDRFVILVAGVGSTLAVHSVDISRLAQARIWLLNRE